MIRLHRWFSRSQIVVRNSSGPARLSMTLLGAMLVVVACDSLPIAKGQEPAKPAPTATAPTPSATAPATPAPSATKPEAAKPEATKPAATTNEPVPTVELKLPSLGGPMAAPPKAKEPAADDELGQLLFSTGIDDILLGKFLDGRPLAGVERQPLVGLFSSIRQFKPADIEDLKAKAKQPSAFAAGPARGKLWELEGRLKSITVDEFTDAEIERVYADVIARLKEEPPKLPANDIRRFFYRCTIEFGEAHAPVTVVALRMPEALLALHRNLAEQPLKVGEVLKVDERVTVAGLFLKSLGEKPGEQPLLVTYRPAWHPDTPLGKLGMDYGLFDDVRLTASDLANERECFFQLMAAMKRAEFGELLDLTTENYSVVPLFNSAKSMHGKLTALTGTARRATLVRVPYPDIHRRFGIDHYYEVAIFTADSRDNPLIFDLLELPPGFPEGDDIHVEVRIPGTFLTGFVYDRDATDKEQSKGIKPLAQKAPLLIGKTLYRYQAKDEKAGSFDWYVSGLILLGALALGAVGWATMRGDRKTRKIMEHTNAPPTGTSLNDLKGDFRNGPDFSNLE
ncbi:MAG: hypothetical protein K8U03_02170 [Planctomycetia bacterium]|nr:hypothetical protein [Planctomycetia bacterium]